MRNPFRREKALTGSAEVREGISQGWEAFPLGAGATQRIQQAYATAQSANYAWLYRNSPAVRTVIDVIVRNIGQLDLRLYEEVKPDERKARPDHEAALSMRYPNETTTADQFVRQLFLDYLIFDNAYAVITNAPGNQITMSWLPSQWMEILSESLLVADTYRYHPPEGSHFVDFPPERILHWKGENPLDPRIGLSRLDTLRDIIAEDVAYQQAMVELAKSGLQEQTMILRPAAAPDWSNKARELFEEDIANRMRRATRRPFVLEEGMTPHQYGISPRDAQIAEIRRFATERIATEFGVPLGMVGLEAPTPEARTQFVADCLPTYCENFTRFLNHRVLVRIYDWKEGAFEFNLDEKLAGDSRLTAFVSATGRAVMLTNEARAKMNLPPVEDGDKLVTPLNVQIGSNPKPAPGVMGPQAPGGPPQDGSFRPGQNGQPPATPKGGQQPTTNAGNANGKNANGNGKSLEDELAEFDRLEHFNNLNHFGERKAAGKPLPQHHPRRSADMRRQQHNVGLAEAVVRGHFNRLDRSLSHRSKSARNGNGNAPKVTDADWSRWNQEFATDVEAVLHKIARDEAAVYMARFGGGEFDVGEVKNYLRVKAEESTKAINDVIRQEIKDLGLQTALARAPQHVASAGGSLGATTTVFARKEAARQAPGFRGPNDELDLRRPASR